MKKTLMTCLAIVAVLAIASSAAAVTCTVDQRPAATLLVPYFQVSFDADGNLVTVGVGARDTIVTIANASAAPMIAHVNLFDRYSVLQLDFNVALTGFDVQAMRLSDVITGSLPDTVNADGEDACQRNPNANVYPSPDGFIRVRPLVPATPQDNLQATTDYNTKFNLPGLIDALRFNCSTGENDDLAIGYLVIDHANYCNLSDPTDPNYYYNDAIGMENNLWGEIIFTSGFGLPTYALSTVNVETDVTFGNAAFIDPLTTVRTFYARYWDPLIDSPPNAARTAAVAETMTCSSPPVERRLRRPARAARLELGRPLVRRRRCDHDELPRVALLAVRSCGAPGELRHRGADRDARVLRRRREHHVAGPCPSPCRNPRSTSPMRRSSATSSTSRVPRARSPAGLR
jgi:hypothetical protein